MKLSIIIPCYKVEKYIDKCLKSVCKFYSQDVEIILVDDGSSDNIPQICDRWAENDSRIRVIHQENGGLSVARNNGLDASTGDYIWFVDSDDWITDDAIQRIFILIDKNPDIDIFTFPLLWAYEETRKNWLDIHLKSDVIITGKEYIDKYPVGASPRNIIKRSFLKHYHIRFFPNILHEDNLFGYILYYQAKNILVLKDYIYNYRQREGSIMHTCDIRSAYSHITMHRQFMKYMETNVERNEQQQFRIICMKSLFNSIHYVWKIHKTSEFHTFLKNTQDYRISECKKLAECGNIRIRIYAYLLAYYPISCYYYKNWNQMLYNTAKQSIKRIWMLLNNKKIKFKAKNVSTQIRV